MVIGNAFSNCNGSYAFSARVAVGSIKVVILNKEPLMRFQMSLKKGPHLRVSLAAVYSAHSAASQCRSH
jgi:hypothetical protein